MALTQTQEIAALKAENERLKAANEKRGQVSLKVGPAGGISVYGMGRFPITAYAEQWEKLMSMASEFAAFTAANAGLLTFKDDSDPVKTSKAVSRAAAGIVAKAGTPSGK